MSDPITKNATRGYTFSNPRVIKLWYNRFSLGIPGGRFTTNGYDVDTHNIYTMMYLNDDEYAKPDDEDPVLVRAGRLARFVDEALTHSVICHSITWVFNTPNLLNGAPITQQTTAAIEWINGKTDGPWSIRLIGNGPNVAVQLFFENEHDAMLCKLRW